MVGSWQVRQRIAAQNRRSVRIYMQPQDNKLTCAEGRKGLPIDRNRTKGSYTLALLTDMLDSHCFESRPRWRFLLIRESRIPRYGFRARFLIEHCLERTLPTFAQCRNPKRAL